MESFREQAAAATDDQLLIAHGISSETNAERSLRGLFRNFSLIWLSGV